MSNIVYRLRHTASIGRWLIAVALLASVATRAAAQAPKEEIRRMLEERDHQIKAIVGTEEKLTPEAKEQLRDLINGVIDFQSMGKVALGRYWKDLSEEQRTNFVDKFAQIVRSQSLADLDAYRAKVTYDEITVSDSTAHVVTTTVYKDVPAQVEYDLRIKDGSWVATDITLDRVSTVQGYARSFQSMIRKKGFDALMAKLDEKLEEVDSKVS